MNQDPTSYCPVFQHTVELIGRRWTASILKVLGTKSLRFSEIRTLVPGLSDRLLDSRLSELETEGIVQRTEVGGDVLYAATVAGCGLAPIFEAVDHWAATNSCAGQQEGLPGRRRC